MGRPKGSKNKPKTTIKAELEAVTTTAPKHLIKAFPKLAKPKITANLPKSIAYIDISKLVIDGTNMRDEAWDQDPEFIEDVKTHEVMNPLLVRPLKDGRYGVICGSRRFNASVDSGKQIVPCIIEDLDDLHALCRSFTENYFRKHVPCWMYQKQVKRIYDVLVTERPTSGKNDLIEEIEKLTGKSRSTIQTIIDIQTNLSEDTKELLKEPEHISKDVQEKAKKHQPQDIKKPLDTHTAQALGSIKDPERQFETALYASSMPQVKALEFVEEVKENPKEDVRKLFEKDKSDVKPKSQEKPKSFLELNEVEKLKRICDICDKHDKNNIAWESLVNFINALYKKYMDQPKQTVKLEAQIATTEASEYVTKRSGHSLVSERKKKS